MFSAKALKASVVLFLAMWLSLATSGIRADAPTEAFPVLFFGNEGPVFLRLQIDAGGVALNLIREQYVDLLFFVLDRNHDSRLDEAEARQIPADGRYGGQATVGEEWREFDTSPNDGVVTQQELSRKVLLWLGLPLQLLERAPPLVQSVQLYSRLDTDGDRRISTSDLESAIETLRSFDFDGDETLSAAELQPFPQSMLAAAILAEMSYDRRPFVLLNEQTEIDSAADRLIATYGGGGATVLSWKSVDLDRRAFAAADINRNRELDQSEVAKLLADPPADVQLLVSLSGAFVRVIARNSERTQLLESEHPRRTALQLGRERVEFEVDVDFGFNDSVGLLMTTRFRSADADSSGSLSEPEYANLDGLDAEFAVVDFDKDGEIIPQELERMALLDARLVQSSVDLSMQRRDAQPLFQLLDLDKDRRLTAREFSQASARLVSADDDNDSGIAEEELQEQGSYLLSFSFGVPSLLRETDPSMMMMAANRRVPVLEVKGMGPLWFQKMDRNLDGDVTWREFLGPRTAFDRLDRDANGWIDVEEAENAP